MNNKGQSLVVFIISIPIFLILIAFLVDGFIVSYQKIHLNSLTRTIIKNNINDVDKKIIIDTFKKNDVDDDIEIINDKGLEIKFTHSVNSFFGKIINKDKYEIKIDLIGTKDGDKINIEKGT